MYQNQDWDMATKRLTAFWHKAIIDRPCLQVYVDNKEFEPEHSIADVAKSAEHYWTDPEIFFLTNWKRNKKTIYYGEALPVLYPNAEHVAIAMGSKVQFSMETIWINKSPGELADLDFSLVTLDNSIIQQMARYFENLVDAAKSECFIGFPHMGNAGDTLARMRGYGNMCIDLYDNLDYCINLEEQILRIWKMTFDLLYHIINQKMNGSCGWLPAWHPGRCALVEFDFCSLISPEHFKRYVPFLVERAAFADHAIFHLDGPGAIKHLDTLLAIDEIGFIQWEPGAGDSNILNWLPLMQKIQAAGKGLYVSGGVHSIEQAVVLLNELSPEGLMIPVSANSIDEARQFLDSAIISH
jgi:hypothetical protein